MPTSPAVPSAYDELHKRLGAMYGQFGDQAVERVEVAQDIDWNDNWRKPTLTLAGSVFALSTFFTYGLGTDSQIINLVLLLAGAGTLFAMLRKKPVHLTIRTVLVLVLFVESSAELANWWPPPMKTAAFMLFMGMKEYASIPGMSLSLFFFVVLYMIWRGIKERRRTRAPKIPRFVWFTPAAFLATVFALVAFGIGRGGASITPLFFQVLQLFTMPLMVALWMLCIRGREDFLAIGSIIVTVALLRSALVVGTYLIAAHNYSHREGFFVTTHSDSVLFAAAFAVVAANAVERRTKEAILWALATTLCLLIGVAFNNRRVALIHLGLAAGVMYMMMKPSKTKRRVTTLLVTGAVLFVAYVIVGSKIESDWPIFKPARLAMSVFEQNDTSSASRVVENFNLVYTFRQSPVFGQGFGHPYEEAYSAYDLTDVFSLYKFIPHNGILWLWSVAGVLFIPGLWFIYCVGFGLAVHAYRVGTHVVDRIAGLTCATIVVTCLTQAWGDQGIHSNLTLSMLALAYAVSAHVCMKKDRVDAGEPA